MFLQRAGLLHICKSRERNFGGARLVVSLQHSLSGSTMANGSGGNGGGTSVLAFILGGAIVIIAIFGFFVYNGHHGSGGNGTSVTATVTKH